MSGEIPKEKYVSRYGHSTKFYGHERTNSFAKPLPNLTPTGWSRSSSPGWFKFLAAGAYGIMFYAYYFYDSIPGAKNRHYVVRRDAGFIGQDGFVENIRTHGTDPKYITRDYLRTGSSDRE